MRELLILLIVAPPLLSIIVGLFFGWQLQRYYDDVREIRSDEQLDRLQRHATVQMYAALLQVPMILVPIGAYMFGVYAGHMSGADVLYPVITSLAMIVVGKLMGLIEKKVQTMPVLNPDLLARRDRIVYVWMTSALPKWD